MPYILLKSPMAWRRSTALKLPVSRHPALTFWNPLAAFRSAQTEVPQSSCKWDRTCKGCGSRQPHDKKSPRKTNVSWRISPVYPHIYFAEISSKFLCIFPVLTYTDCKEIRDFSWAGRKTQVHQKRGSSPLFFYKYFRGGSRWKNWVFFIDESGDFGEYDYHSPYYIITMVFMIRTRISNQLFQNWTGNFLIWI